MIYLNSKVVLWSSLALLAISGCKNAQRDEPAEHPGAEGEQEPAAEATAGTPATGTAAPAATATATAKTATGNASTASTADGTAATEADLLVLTVTGVDIDTKLAEVCKLPGSSVFFKYNSAQLSPEAKDRLQAIATCATTGAAKGQDLVIVGRTDPVGSDQFNKQLGMSRAESVSRYLHDLGVSRSRVEVQSRGEQGAIRDPFGWPLDRRVTIRLQP